MRISYTLNIYNFIDFIIILNLFSKAYVHDITFEYEVFCEIYQTVLTNASLCQCMFKGQVS